MRKTGMSARWGVLLLGVVFAACGSAQKIDPDRPSEVAALEAGYGSLAKLLGSERRIGQILIVKSASPEVRALVKDIVSFAADLQDELEDRRGLHPAVGIDQPSQLPPIRAAASDAIASGIRRDLLFGDKFETRLLLSQGRALLYGASLTKVLSESDPNTERSAWMAEASKGFETLYERVVDLLADAGGAGEEEVERTEAAP